MPRPTPSPHLLSCAQHRCLMPDTEVSAMTSQGPIRSLWPGQTSPGTYGKRVCWVTPCASLGGCRTKSRGLCPHPSTAGSPASSHGASEAVLGLLWHVFSHLFPLARGQKGKPLCSAPIKSPLGTTTHLGSHRQADKPEVLRGGKEALWCWDWFSMEQRRGWGTSQHSPVPVGKASKGWDQAFPSTT